jgi:hypothetical protein
MSVSLALWSILLLQGSGECSSNHEERVKIMVATRPFEELLHH